MRLSDSVARIKVELLLPCSFFLFGDRLFIVTGGSLVFTHIADTDRASMVDAAVVVPIPMLGKLDCRR